MHFYTNERSLFVRRANHVTSVVLTITEGRGDGGGERERESRRVEKESEE